MSIVNRITTNALIAPASLDLALAALPEVVDVVVPLVAGAAAVTILLLLSRRARHARIRELERCLDACRHESETILNAANGIVWTAAADGSLIRHAAWARLTGQTPDQLRGLGWMDAVHPEDRARSLLAWTTALSQQVPFELFHRIRRADGRHHHMLARAVPFHGAPQEERWLGLHIDLSEHLPLHDAGAHYIHRVLDHLFSFVSVLSVDGTLIMTNEAPLKAAGIRFEDVAGKPFWDCYWWNWSPAVQAQLKRAIAHAAGGVSSRYDAEIRIAGGTLITMDFMLAPMRDEDGRITHLIPSGVDVSDRKNAERALAEREQFYRQLIEGMPLLTWTCLPDGSCDYVSNRWQSYAGQDADFAGGFATMDPIHPQDRAAAAAAWHKNVAEGNGFELEMRIRRHDGVYRWFACYVTPLRDTRDQIVKWCCTGIDTDDRKQMEEALRQSETSLRTMNSTLEKRVRDRTAEAVARSEQLRALALDLAETESRERKRLAQILHDHFQQLVSAAKLKAGLLRRKSDNEPSQKALRDIESLLEEAINASRSVATELSPPVLHDAGLVAAFQWLLRRMEQDHQLVINMETSGQCEPDNEQVRTIVFECTREILFNVRKHAGVDTASLRVERLPEGLLRIQVTDRGRGFDTMKLERRNSSDTSFGLFSIRERLGLIGGLLTVRSKPGEGTCVEISVPCVSSPQRGAARISLELGPPQGPSLPQSRKLRVLVADDHAIFREGLVALLTQETGVEVIAQAGDGVEAVEMARQYRPDVMIVDISMPRMNGVQVTSTISRELPEIRIIGLSMYEQQDMAKAMLDAGAMAYCPKSGAADDTLLNLLRSAATAPAAG